MNVGVARIKSLDTDPLYAQERFTIRVRDNELDDITREQIITLRTMFDRLLAEVPAEDIKS